jgi:hypothetical protein
MTKYSNFYLSVPIIAIQDEDLSYQGGASQYVV